MIHDPLEWRSVIRVKARSQRFMSCDDLINRGRQSRDIQRAAKAKGTADIVKGIARLKLIQKPESLLSERQRQLAVFGYGENRRHLQAASALHDLLDPAGHRRHCGTFKESAYGEIDIQSLPQTCGYLRRQQ